MTKYYFIFTIFFISIGSLCGKKDINLKYERLWTDILPKDLSIWGDGKYNYKRDFRKKYIGLFIVPNVDESYSCKNVIEFTSFIREYAKKYKNHISIFVDGSDSGIETIFSRSLDENIFQVHGNVYKYKKTVYTNHLVTSDDKYTSDPSSPRWLLIFDDRGRYVDNVRIEVINDIEGKKKYRPWEN